MHARIKYKHACLPAYSVLLSNTSLCFSRSISPSLASPKSHFPVIYVQVSALRDFSLRSKVIIALSFFFLKIAISC